jgi:hypothetical protein
MVKHQDFIKNAIGSKKSHKPSPTPFQKKIVPQYYLFDKIPKLKDNNEVLKGTPLMPSTREFSVINPISPHASPDFNEFENIINTSIWSDVLNEKMPLKSISIHHIMNDNASVSSPIINLRTGNDEANPTRVS